MAHRKLGAIIVFLVFLVFPMGAKLLLAQPIFTRSLCAGRNYVSLPTESDLMTAEDLCAAISVASSVAQLFPTSGPTYTYDCLTATCTSSGPFPEPGCSASSCFCIDDGEGFEVMTTAAGSFDIYGCDSFVPIVFPAGGQQFLISVPYDRPASMVTWYDLGVHFGLPSTGVTRGTIEGYDCVEGFFRTCTMGGANNYCNLYPLVTGEAYRVGFTSPPVGPFSNPVDCNPPLPTTGCPMDVPNVVDLGGGDLEISWVAPTGCLLPLVYDVIRGDLSCLQHACSSHPTPACTSCVLVVGGTALTTVIDTPPSTTNNFYLVRVSGGTLNSTSASQCVDYDLLGCP